MQNRTLALVGAILWVLGLGMAIVGMNLGAPAGTWLNVIGNILFFLGLLLEGILWVKRKKEEPSEEKKEEKTA